MNFLTRFFSGNSRNTGAHRLLSGLSLAALLGLAACGGGGGPSDSGGNPITPVGSAGKISWVTTERINNRTENVIKTMDASTGAVQMFVAGDFTEKGVSAARNGTLAYLKEFDDSYEIRIVRTDGSQVASFFWNEDLTFLVDGARISPDANHVAFSLNRIEGNTRTDAVYLCNTQGAIICYWFNNLRSPAWLGDGRLIARNSAADRIYAINVTTRALNPIGPVISSIDDLAGTPNSSHILFSTNNRPNRIRALNLATNAVTTLSDGGTGQYKPLVSSDGASLFYMELCCGGGFDIGALRRTPLNLSGTFSGGVQTNLVRDAGGNIVFPGDVYGQF
jgi:hypothetical protein